MPPLLKLYCSVLKLRLTVVRKTARPPATDDHDWLRAAALSLIRSITAARRWLTIVCFVMVRKDFVWCYVFEININNIVYTLLVSFTLEIFLFLSHLLITWTSVGSNSLIAAVTCRTHPHTTEYRRYDNIVKHYTVVLWPSESPFAAKWRLPHRWWLVFADGLDKKNVRRPLYLI